MEISAAALPFLILAAALGPPALGYPDPGHCAHELIVAEDESQQVKFFREGAGVHRPPDCCPSYTTRKIRCVFMERYYKTSGCPLPAVIFITKRGQEVCADPQNERVQECMLKLDSAYTREKWLFEEELY